MISQENVLSFLDLLDLDEELIDARLKSIMKREKYSNKNLTSAIQLLQYKHLVNLQDNSECENEEECEFVVKLIKEIDISNVENVCKIISITLGLNATTLVNRSEHLIQQIMCELPVQIETDDVSNGTSAVLILKIADSILDAVIKDKQRLSLPFLEIPVKNILFSSNENMKVHFLSCTVPKLFEAVTNFNILDSIWNCVKNLEEDNKSISLKVLSSLSDYYLPAPDDKGNILFESNIIHGCEFWLTVLYGMMSSDSLLRKISIYLAKRALDCVITQARNVSVMFEGRSLFQWCKHESNSLKIMWDNYFILIDSLEEKQSNIVLPSLQLFSTLKTMGHWLNCAFNIGLKHDNTQVRFKCIQHRLEIKLNSQQEAVVLLEALNNISIYDNADEIEELKSKLIMFITDKEVFMHIFTSIPLVKWSPVPFYHLTNVLSDIKLNINGQLVMPTVTEILKIPCNNVPLREAAHVNVSHFIGNCCSGLHWSDYANIYSSLKTDILVNCGSENPFKTLMMKKVKNEDKLKFCEFLLQSYLNIDFGFHYFNHHQEELIMYIELLCEKMKKVELITVRQYSDKRECLNDVIYITQIICKTYNRDNMVSEAIHAVISQKLKTILVYVSGLLINNTILSIEECTLISDGLCYMSDVKDINDIKKELLQLYKTSVLFIKDKNVALESIVLGLHIVTSLNFNTILLTYYKHEMLSLKDVLTLVAKFENKQSIGRLRNAFYEKCCEVIDAMLNQIECDVNGHVEDIVQYIEVVLDCGGYGCLRWCLRITNKILTYIIRNESIKFNMRQFTSRIWKEIEELKSNNQYAPCIEEFINLITNDQLLRIPEYNNIVILYCKKIIDYGSVKVTPLFHLISKLNSKDLTRDYGHVVYILCEVLLYSPVPRKDQRITENLVVKVLKEKKYNLKKTEITENLVVKVLKEKKYNLKKTENDTHFNFQVQYLSVLTLSKIKDPEILCTIERFIMNRINELFRSKQRYHGHSEAHRVLLAGLQHLLLISLMKPSNSEDILNWCIEFLGKLPHQASVRMCMEWYIALHLYVEGISINEELLKRLNGIPQISQLLILYWTVKRIILRGHDMLKDYEFVMDFILSHTMGQMFNTRLHAQYLGTKLWPELDLHGAKYAFTMKVIEETFKESESDKNYVKMKNDYFVNDFEIIKDLTPSFLYYFQPRYCEIDNNESIDLDWVKNILNNVNSNIAANIADTDFSKEWLACRRSDDEVFSLNLNKDDGNKLMENLEAVGTIQKKYIPWRNMSDINVYETVKRKDNKSELIVVASLIDKLPNLGGMARTSEVFGVKSYVVDSLRHLQDKQFQSLSVSAERWIDVEEVRPGRPLKEYLMAKKSEGYIIVAAEQTSTSVQLQAFRFPLKTLLLLGHEKEGIPCDLLPMMDYCVEIPQQGFVRSLNVHVTAAIFVWEYARQNVL